MLAIVRDKTEKQTERSSPEVAGGAGLEGIRRNYYAIAGKSPEFYLAVPPRRFLEFSTSVYRQVLSENSDGNSSVCPYSFLRATFGGCSNRASSRKRDGRRLSVSPAEGVCEGRRAGARKERKRASGKESGSEDVYVERAVNSGGFVDLLPEDR